MACDPKQLVKDAECISCSIPEGMLWPVAISLLCQIANPAPPVASVTFLASHLDALRIDNDRTDTILNLPNLTTVALDFDVEVSSFTQVNVLSLNSIGGSLILSDLNVKNISFPSLTTIAANIGGQLQIESTGVFPNSPVTISFPNLVTIASPIAIDTNTKLTTISLPKWKPTAGLSFDFSGNALLAATVNQILARLVTTAAWGTTGESVNLSGGTSSPPTGQGVIDKATLIGRGANVSTN